MKEYQLTVFDVLEKKKKNFKNNKELIEALLKKGFKPNRAGDKGLEKTTIKKNDVDYDYTNVKVQEDVDNVWVHKMRYIDKEKIQYNASVHSEKDNRIRELNEIYKFAIEDDVFKAAKLFQDVEVTSNYWNQKIKVKC